MFTFIHRNPEMQLDKGHTALFLADVQNEFLTEGGTYYPLIEESLRANKVPDHLEELLPLRQGMRLPSHPLAALLLPDRWPVGRSWRCYLALPRAGGLRRPKGSSEPGRLRGVRVDFPERYRKYLQDGKTL